MGGAALMQGPSPRPLVPWGGVGRAGPWALAVVWTGRVPAGMGPCSPGDQEPVGTCTEADPSEAAQRGLSWAGSEARKT